MEDFKLEGLQGGCNGSIGALNNYISNSECSLPATTKFTIPILKAKPSKEGSQSNINQFLLKQLQTQDTNHTGRFKVPKLGKDNNGGVFTVPALKRENVSNTSSQIVDNTRMNCTQLEMPQDHENKPQSEEHLIDLTSALSATRIDSSKNVLSRDKRNKAQREIFEIPFIECDRQQPLPQTDNYCLIDISRTQFQHNLAPPSTLGRILSSKSRGIRNTRPVVQKSTFKAKHHVDRFLFDTKSPDDVISAALTRFTRK